MSKCSDKERALLEVARHGWQPPIRVKDAVRDGIAARLRAEPILGADGPGPSPVARSVQGLARGPWAAGIGFTVVGLCLVFAARGLDHEAPGPLPASTPLAASAAPPAVRSESPRAAEPTLELSSEAAPSSKAAPLDSAASAPADAPTKKRAELAASTRLATRPANADRLAEEVALVRAAQKSLREGAPANALESLATHAARFPKGALTEERMTLQVLSFCALGEVSRARSIRADLESLAPASSHLQRVSRACP